MPDLDYVRGWLGRYWLACWFGIISATRLSAVYRGEIGFDARLYVAAARAWLAGNEPWIYIGPQQFAAPPPTLLPLAPLTLLPDAIAIAALLFLAVVGVAATIRVLRLPWWWVLFPPFVDGMWNGNIQTTLVPLILVGAGPVAAFLKIYAIIPIALTLRWRSLVVMVAALAVTAPLLPWASYLDHTGELVQAFVRQSSGGLSATAVPLLIPIALGALALCGREKTAWLAVPAIWPYTQWYYSSLAVPALVPATVHTSVAAALLALPLPGIVVGAVVVVAVGERNWTRRRLIGSWVRSPGTDPD